jgi:hypothetical protein
MPVAKPANLDVAEIGVELASTVPGAMPFDPVSQVVNTVIPPDMLGTGIIQLPELLI